VEKGEITRGDCGHGGRKDRLFLLLSQINHLRASEAKHRQPLFGGCMDECNLRQTKQKKNKKKISLLFLFFIIAVITLQQHSFPHAYSYLFRAKCGLLVFLPLFISYSLCLWSSLVVLVDE
jgi:hypothetical protein